MSTELARRRSKRTGVITLGCFEFAEDGSGARQKCLTDLGQADRAAQAVKKAGAEFVFELEDLLRQRWLGNVRLHRGTTEGIGVRDGAKIAELMDFHTAS